MVDLAAFTLASLCEVVVQSSRDQDGRVVSLSGLFELGGHVNIWTQVSRINLVEATQGTLNSPALMESEAHLDLIVGHTSVQTCMIRILSHFT